MSAIKTAARAVLGRAYEPLQRRWSSLLHGWRHRQAERFRRGVHDAVTVRTSMRVADGPFAGMRYVSKAAEGNLLPKLVGSYEIELAEVIERIAATPYDHVINIGAADGYYAVGLALRLPRSRVFAIDIDPEARAAVEHTARLNGVSDRVFVAAALEPATLGAERVLIVCDCEGCERDLLDPARTPELLRADILVELHEFVAADMADVIARRFAETHTIEIIAASERDPSKFGALSDLRPAQQRYAVDEFRPPGMRWAWMTVVQKP